MDIYALGSVVKFLLIIFIIGGFIGLLSKASRKATKNAKAPWKRKKSAKAASDDDKANLQL